MNRNADRLHWSVAIALGVGMAALAVVTACQANNPTTGTRVAAVAAVATAAGCFDPIGYGAVPNDGIDDRTAMQAAIDDAGAAASGGVPAIVCISTGRYTLSRAPIGSYNRFAALSTHGKNLTIRCDAAVLELIGDQGNSATLLISIDPSAENVRITGCVLDSTHATNTHEQTHAIATSGICSDATCRPIKNIEIDHNRFLWPRNTASRKGDCVRLLGDAAPDIDAPGTELWGARVHDNTGDCARSFVEIQRGVHDAVIDRNTIACVTCDQDVDGEATGVVGERGRPTGIVVSNNTFTDGPDTQGDFAIAMTSADRVLITGNTMGRGIAIYRSTDVVITGNAIASTETTSERAVIDVANRCDGLTIASNVIRRGGHVGPLIALKQHSGAMCSGAVIADNTLTQRTAAWAIVLESASGVAIASNRIVHAAPAPGYSSIYARAVITGATLSSLAVTNNQITGAVTYAVRLTASPGSFGEGILISGNSATGSVMGLHCEDGNFAAPIVSTGNAWLPGVAPGATVNTGRP